MASGLIGMSTFGTAYEANMHHTPWCEDLEMLS